MLIKLDRYFNEIQLVVVEGNIINKYLLLTFTDTKPLLEFVIKTSLIFIFDIHL